MDEKSPAGAAGLKKGDIIIEINGVNITRENHAQIVARIKASGDCTLFLVADQECKVRCFMFQHSVKLGKGSKLKEKSVEFSIISFIFNTFYKTCWKRPNLSINAKIFWKIPHFFFSILTPSLKHYSSGLS